MDAEDEGKSEGRWGSQALDRLLVVPSALLEGLPDAVVAAEADGRIVFVNALGEELFGYGRDELVGKPVQTLWPERLRERYTRNMDLYFATEHPLRFTTEAWGLRRDGSEFMGEMSWGIIRTTGGPLLLAIGRDISARRATEHRQHALAAIGERALAGTDPAALAGEALELLRETFPIAGGEVRFPGGMLLASSGLSRTGQTIALSVGSGQLLVMPERELTGEEVSHLRAMAQILATALARLRGEEQMRHDAVHDPLTGLANRVLLRDRLEQALARSERSGGDSGLLFVDLDNFKQINDLHGHATGDAVLVELGQRLQRAVRPTDTVARLGGDEFVVVCDELDEGSAFALGRRLHEAIQLPITIDGVQHQLTASIGVALGQADPDALLGNADAAVYRAKSQGRGRVELFR